MSHLLLMLGLSTTMGKSRSRRKNGPWSPKATSTCITCRALALSFSMISPLLSSPSRKASMDRSTNMLISAAALRVADKVSRSPEGDFLWYGPNLDSRLSGDASGGAMTADPGYAQTICRNVTCEGAPVGFGDKLFKKAVREFDSIIGTSSADLSEFRAAGGKLITYHGSADHLIPFKGSVHYYDEVLKIDANARTFTVSLRCRAWLTAPAEMVDSPRTPGRRSLPGWRMAQRLNPCPYISRISIRKPLIGCCAPILKRPCSRGVLVVTIRPEAHGLV
ncbi:uncharacterized protein B0H64DRAFT_180938 [Chaetomium fimeti]|uniref:Carboxylic ester hydrolase n=1 Tax=Chaetomium fimeti TaxID=1854472 RepID=A0AAE0HCR9_9PEZI|nr:hypothetical protein B0H64DRAFT_180938 [Chaetomium fimeti]